MASIYDKSSLVLIPSGTKTGKVYSQKPVSGDGDFTFTRSSAATRVNADGNIEKETQNLLVQSNNFDTTWQIGGAGTITENQAGYDGTNNASLLTKTAAWTNVNQNVNQSGVQTFSVYVKANASTWALLVADHPSTDPIAYFDLTNGVVGSTTHMLDPNIVDVGNGWWRISITYNMAISQVRVYPAEANTASGTSGSIYIQDAQLEQGLVARDYIETTTSAVEGGITDNVPRLDYTDSSCPALLLEPQRTNLVYQSEYLGAWAAANCSVTANSITSPEGVTNSFKITENSAASTQHRVSLGSIGGSSATYTMSAYVKNSSGTRMAYIDMGPVTAHFNFSTETIYSAQGTADYEDVGDGWYRIWVTSNSAVSVVTCFAGLSVNNNETYSGDGSSAIEFYGIQLEAGSYATSYIPTYGSSVTRNADFMTATSLDTNSIITNNDSWSAFFEIELLGNDSPNDKIQLSDASNVPRAYLYANIAGVAGTGWSGSEALTMNTNNKIMYRANSDTNISFFENGVNEETFTSTGDALTFNRVNFYGNNGAFRLKQALLFPTALTDQEAIDLTTI